MPPRPSTTSAGALASYTAADAGKAALLAAISKAPRDYAPVPGNPRPTIRRNQILALMARNGYIPEEPREALPGRADPRRSPQPDQDRFPCRDRARPQRAGPAWRDPLRGRGPVPGPDRGQLDDRRAGAGDRERGPRARSGAVREAASQGTGNDPGLGGRAGERGCGHPGRGGRAAGLQGSGSALLRLQPRHGLAAPAGLRDEAAGVPGRVRVGAGPRHHGARRAHRGAARQRRRHQVDRQLRQPVQGPDTDAPGPGRVAQHRGRVAHA